MDAIDLTALRDRVAASVPSAARQPAPATPLCSCGCGRPRGKPTPYSAGKPCAELSDHCRKVRVRPGQPRRPEPDAAPCLPSAPPLAARILALVRAGRLTATEAVDLLEAV